MTEAHAKADLAVLQALIENLGREDLMAGDKISAVLELALAHRVSALGRELIPVLGDRVAAGPFAGMRYQPKVSEGCVIPKMLGCYEQELHAELRRIGSASYDTVLNIGCAEGYYAVGLARLLPNARIEAWDIDPTSRERAAENARLNGVEDRVRFGEQVDSSAFESFASGRVLLVCDIEGAELELLNPTKAPALSAFDMVVEMHPGPSRSVADFLGPFSATHECQVLHFEGRDPREFPLLKSLSPLDQTLALTERTEATPWAIMRSRSLNR